MPYFILFYLMTENKSTSPPEWLHESSIAQSEKHFNACNIFLEKIILVFQNLIEQEEPTDRQRNPEIFCWTRLETPHLCHPAPHLPHFLFTGTLHPLSADVRSGMLTSFPLTSELPSGNFELLSDFQKT